MRPATRLTHSHALGERREVYDDALSHWRGILEEFEGDRVELLLGRVAELTRQRARIQDRWRLAVRLISDGVAKLDGTMSDQDAIGVLVGWASEHRALMASGEEEE